MTKMAGVPRAIQEDVNGEKLTMEKWWIFGADFFTVYAEFFAEGTQTVKKHLVIDDLFHG